MVGFVSANPDPVACGVATAVIHTPDDIYYCGAGMSVDMDIPSCRRCGIHAACADIAAAGGVAIRIDAAAAIGGPGGVRYTQPHRQCCELRPSRILKKRRRT